MRAYFAFEQLIPSGELKQFVFQLNDAAKIEEARRILASGNQLKAHVQGKVVPRPADYNPGWSFHLDPETIGFFEFQIEVCDANVAYVEEHLDEVGGAFLPNRFWCPWTSRLSKEVSC